MLFSQRQGLKPVKDIIQRESVDADLRTGLWNALGLILDASNDALQYLPEHLTLANRLWANYFRQPIDTIPNRWPQVRTLLRNYYFDDKRRWNEVYDFVEFVVRNYPDARAADAAVQVCNGMLERELSAWRFVDKQLVEVTSETEIRAIEEALSNGQQGSRAHLRAALEMLSDRDSPDYRNSIKESISAVEAEVNSLTGTKSTLGAGLKQLPAPLHPALEGGLTKLYGWTSDAEGIRHALMDEPSLTSNDAKFMLVSCSAFVNYLVALAAQGT